jgi:putative membrane protein
MDAKTSPPVDDPRVYLAAERTYLAWVRTSLGLMGFGFLIARFGYWMRGLAAIDHDHAYHSKFSPYLGFMMVCFGVGVCVVAAVRHRQYVRSLRAGVANPPLSLAATMALAAVLAVAGLAMAIHILTT